MDIDPNNCNVQIIILTIISIIIMGFCVLSFLISIYFVYNYSQNTEIKTIYVPIPNDQQISNNTNSSDNDYFSDECPPINALKDYKCKNNINWLQQIWTPSMASGIMKEGTQCYAYKKAKSENLCK